MKIMMIAGEASGDIHCARLASKLKELCPSSTLFGMGGQLMAQAGVELEYDIADLAAIGITEGIVKLPLLLGRLKGLKSLIDLRRPDVIVLVDFPDFNMRLLPFAHKRHVPVVYYIPPKAWAWRKKRAKILANYTTAVASIFPFEAEVYREAGANVQYVGHPLLDFAKPSLSKTEAYEKFYLNDSHPVIGLMPGSRKTEIKKLLPIMLESARLIRAEIPDCQFILPIAHTIPRDMIPDMTNPPVTTIDGADVYNMMNITDLIIVASGTATLEAAYMIAPMIVIYRVSMISWIVMRSLVSANVKSTALPNIIADRFVVPELLQRKANPVTMSEIAVRMMKNPAELAAQKAELQKVRDQLGDPGAVERTARLVIQAVG